jgi:hypothetical protein
VGAGEQLGRVAAPLVGRARAGVSVVVPRTPGSCPHRDRAWEWVKARYAAVHPSWEVVEGLGGVPWCKAAAIDDGLSRASGETLIVADADCWTDGLAEAVDLLDEAPWVVPHLTVHRLTPTSTDAVLAGADPADAHDFDQAPYHGWAGGGFFVIRRADYQRAPLDPRFAGWGLEDASFALAADELVGPHQRLTWPLWHLWHPPQPRLNRRIGSQESEALWRRYRRSRGRKDRMAALIAEGRPGWPSNASSATATASSPS